MSSLRSWWPGLFTVFGVATPTLPPPPPPWFTPTHTPPQGDPTPGSQFLGGWWWLGGVCDVDTRLRDVLGMLGSPTSWCSPDVLLMTELCPSDMAGMRSAEDRPPNGPDDDDDDVMGFSPTAPTLSNLGSLAKWPEGVGAVGRDLNRGGIQGGATAPSIVFMKELDANMDDDRRSTGSSPAPFNLGA